MWSQPDIKALNARAKSCATAYDRETKLKKSVKNGCECCGKPSVVHEKFYDIFSDDAKGVRHLCREHSDDGRGDEGYFTCACCERLMVENYTWEYYRTTDPQTGEMICLPCAAKNYFADDDNLINPDKVKSVCLSPGGINRELFDEKSGVINLAHAPHLIGVDMPLPKGVVFVENCEFDSTSGHQISGGNLLDIIRAQKSSVFVVMDAAFQFAVSLAVYVRE